MHVLGRRRFGPPCPVASRPICSKMDFSPVWERSRVLSLFSTHRSTIMSLQPKPGWRRNTSSAVEQCKPRSDCTTLSSISSNAVCREHEISPLPIVDLLENSQADTAHYRQESISSENGKTNRPTCVHEKIGWYVRNLDSIVQDRLAIRNGVRGSDQPYAQCSHHGR